MLFLDRLTLDAPKRTKEGFLAVRAKAARTGIYDYLGCELDPKGEHFAADKVVKVYRPAEEVFSRDAVHSFLLKPVTDDHPTVPVTADNWKQHARGVAAGAMRDGDFLAFDLVIMDKAAIESIDSGKRELSNGYSSELDLTPGTFEGQHYDAVQRNIRGNHIALVKAGRAGHECRIGDAKACDAISLDGLAAFSSDSQTYRRENNRDNSSGDNSFAGSGAAQMATFNIDGIPFEMSDQAVAAVKKLQGQLDDAKARADKAEGDVATLTTDKQKLEAEKTVLQSQLDAAKLTPAQLRDAAKQFADVVAKAKALGVSVTDSMDSAAIVKACVVKHAGDASKDWTVEQLDAAFAMLKADSRRAPDPVREILTDGAVNISDTASIRDSARVNRYAN